MVERLPENRTKSSYKEYEIKRKEDLRKRKKIMEEYGNKLKNDVISKSSVM